MAGFLPNPGTAPPEELLCPYQRGRGRV
jgi:hypothetical protein